MHNAKVYLATRDEQKARKAIAELKVETSGKEAVFLKLDLADLRNIRSAAEEFLAYVAFRSCRSTLSKWQECAGESVSTEPLSP